MMLGIKERRYKLWWCGKRDEFGAGAMGKCSRRIRVSDRVMTVVVF